MAAPGGTSRLRQMVASPSFQAFRSPTVGPIQLSASILSITTWRHMLVMTETERRVRTRHWLHSACVPARGTFGERRWLLLPTEYFIRYGSRMAKEEARSGRRWSA